MDASKTMLEAALVASPDDGTAHAAYADCLIEEGDPRGEYIRLLLALEDRDQPAGDLQRLHENVRRLEALHSGEWYGAIRQRHIETTLRRGWIECIRVGTLSQTLLDAIIAKPATMLLRELVVMGVSYDVRTLDAAEMLGPYLRRTPLDTLFLANWSLGDAGIEALVQPLPPRLRKLTLRNCSITDDGAESLARCLPQLEHLDLDGNLLSPIGVAALAASPAVRLGRQRFIGGGEATVEI